MVGVGASLLSSFVVVTCPPRVREFGFDGSTKDGKEKGKKGKLFSTKKKSYSKPLGESGDGLVVVVVVSVVTGEFS